VPIHRLVNRIVDDFPDQMVQSSRTDAANVHAGAFANRFKVPDCSPLEAQVKEAEQAHQLAKQAHELAKQRQAQYQALLLPTPNCAARFDPCWLPNKGGAPKMLNC